MANRLKGITLEIGGDTTELSKSLSAVNKEIKDTQSQLKDVQKLLKMDPGNTELLKQKYKLLTDQVKQTGDKLKELKDAQANMDAKGVDKASDQYMNLRREIIDTENSLKNLEKAARESNVTLQKVATSAQKLSDASAKVASATKGLSMVAAGGLAALGGAAYSAMTLADDLNTLAKQTGFSTEELQKFQYAADRIDVSMETITGAVAKMKKGMKDSGIEVGKFTVNTVDASGNMRDVTDVFYDVVNALSRIENETDRDRIAMNIFGKSADQLAGVIDDGGKALREYGDEAERLGLILDQETLDSLNEANDQIDKLKAVSKGTLAKSGAKALNALMPLFEKIVAALGKVLDMIGNLSEGQIAFLAGLLSVTAAISPVASGISKVSGAVAKITPMLPKLGAAFTGFGTKALAACKGVAAFFVANPIGLAILALIAAVALFGDKIKAILGKVDEWLQGVFAKDWREVFGDRLGGALNRFMQIVKSLWDGFKQVMDGVIDFIRGVFTGNWRRAWDGVKNIFSGVFNSIKNIARNVLGWISGETDSTMRKLSNSQKYTSGTHSGSYGKLPGFANGGTLYSGTALVGEAGPELLTVSGGRATVTPLTATIDSKSLAALSGSHQNAATTVNISFNGNLAQLAKLLQPAIETETGRRGPSLINY